MIVLVTCAHYLAPFLLFWLVLYFSFWCCCWHHCGLRSIKHHRKASFYALSLDSLSMVIKSIKKENKKDDGDDNSTVPVAVFLLTAILKPLT